MRLFIIAFAVVFVVAVLALIVTRVFGLWPEWMIQAELVIKSWLSG